MKQIQKGPEPACLTGTRREAVRIETESNKPPATSDWDLKDCAQAVRDNLDEEQGGLCAYCCGRITAAEYEPTARTGMKIEHFVPRATDPRQMYTWSNLLGVCGGRHMWAGQIVRTCDEPRGRKTLHVHPVGNPRPETVFLPRRDGTLVAVGPGPVSDLEVLNLQAAVLRHNRAAVVSRLQLLLEKDDSEGNIRRMLRVATTPPFESYSFVAEWYLNLKLRGATQRAARPR